MRGKDEAGIQIIPGVLSSKTGGKVCRGRSIAPCCQTAEIRLFSCSALRLQEVSPWIPRTMQSGSQRAAKICYELEAVIRGTLTDVQAEEGCSAPCHRSGEGSRNRGVAAGNAPLPRRELSSLQGMAAEAVPCAWWIGRDRRGVGGGKKVCVVPPETAAPSFLFTKCRFEFLYKSFSHSSIYIVQLCKGYSDMTKQAKSVRDYLLNIQAERKEIEVLKAVPSARGWTMEQNDSGGILRFRIRQLKDRQEQARAMIDALPDDRERAVLVKFFFEDQLMPDIAEGICYSERRAWVIYGRALDHLAAKGLPDGQT